VLRRWHKSQRYIGSQECWHEDQRYKASLLIIALRVVPPVKICLQCEFTARRFALVGCFWRKNENDERQKVATGDFFSERGKDTPQ
jgi:hypothetical protein